MTVGEIYGCSPLSESDDPLTDPAMLHEAELVSGSGTASLAGGPMLAAGRARLRRDRPTDILVAGWALAALRTDKR